MQLLKLPVWPRFSGWRWKLTRVGGEFVDDCLRVVGGAVVDDLDLHLLGTGVLEEDAGERLAEVAGAVVGGHHHRPERTVLLVCRRSDWTSERPGSLRIGNRPGQCPTAGSFEKQLGEAGRGATPVGNERFANLNKSSPAVSGCCQLACLGERPVGTSTSGYDACRWAAVGL